jgi:hypothetical protein
MRQESASRAGDIASHTEPWPPNLKEIDKIAPFVPEKAPDTQDSSLRLGFQADPVKAASRQATMKCFIAHEMLHRIGEESVPGDD